LPTFCSLQFARAEGQIEELKTTAETGLTVQDKELQPFSVIQMIS
jgi:hypothetical protein